MISSPSEVNYPDQSCRRLGGLTIASKDIVPEYSVPKARDGASGSCEPHRCALEGTLSATSRPGTAYWAISQFYRVFFEELRRLGYVEGRNLAVARYSAEGRVGSSGESGHRDRARAGTRGRHRRQQRQQISFVSDRGLERSLGDHDASLLRVSRMAASR